ncbi:unnamed protein product, partial [Ectocarpus sp. 13 AM-2016]
MMVLCMSVPREKRGSNREVVRAIVGRRNTFSYDTGPRGISRFVFFLFSFVRVEGTNTDLPNGRGRRRKKDDCCLSRYAWEEGGIERESEARPRRRVRVSDGESKAKAG